MIRRARMTIAYLKKRMDGRFKTQRRDTNRRFAAVDRRFDAVDERLDRMSARMDTRFDSMSDKLSAILRILETKYQHHDHILHEHERRIKDLERPTGT
jgi:flagellar capping protein FliD